MAFKIFNLLSSDKKRARTIAIVWTLLILIACLLPANEIPDVKVPLIDKWVHFFLFGSFSFLWLCTIRHLTSGKYLLIFILTITFGWLTEGLQWLFSSLGRVYENMDIVADGIGGLIGTSVFYFVQLKDKDLPKL